MKVNGAADEKARKPELMESEVGLKNRKTLRFLWPVCVNVNIIGIGVTNSVEYVHLTVIVQICFPITV